MQPAILIATTNCRPYSARLAQAFALAGCHVSMISPQDNPARKLRSIPQHLAYRARSPLAALRAAIASTSPFLIVACDDLVVDHLHQLYAEENRSGDPAQIASLIERSLGDPAAYGAVHSQASLLRLAQSLAIEVAETRVLHNTADLESWRDTHTLLPWVLRARSSACPGAHLVHSWKQAVDTFLQLQHSLSATAFPHYLREHDRFAPAQLSQEQPEVTVQPCISGHRAMAIYACRQGEILGEITVKVLSAEHDTGDPTVVRTLICPAMTRVANLLVKRLGLSGFCGFDFILEEETGEPVLVEVHTHATPLAHLQTGTWPDLAMVVTSQPGRSVRAVSHPEKTIAFFPQAWLSNPMDPLLASTAVQHDIPWGEPEFLRELYQFPSPRRDRSSKLFQLAHRLLSRPKSSPDFEGMTKPSGVILHQRNP